MRDKAIKLLKEKKLRITEARISILSLFITSEMVYSFSDLEEKFKNDCDRSTIFRILKGLLSCNLLEQFVSSDGTANYILRINDCHCTDNSHFHFKCTACDKVSHLPKLPEAYISRLGKGSISSLNLVIEGICEDCITKTNPELA